MSQSYYDVVRTAPTNSLPLTVHMRASKKAPVLYFLMAGAALAFALSMENTLPAYLIAQYPYLPLAAGGLAALMALRGLAALLRRGQATIDREHVSFTSRSLLGWRSWREPLSAYQGVRWQRFVFPRDRASDTSNSRTYYRHVIELLHPDAGKTLPLFVRSTGGASSLATLALFRKAVTTRNPSEAERSAMETEAARLGREAAADNPREHWEAFAAMLGLPAIDARDGADEVREAQDLDKSVKELVEQGKVDLHWQQADAAPPSLRVETLGDASDPRSQELNVVILAGAVPKPIIFALAAIGAVLAISGIVFFKSGALLGGALFGGAAYGIRWLERRNPRRFSITREQIQYVDPNVSRRGFTLALDAIESISIRDRDSQSLESVKTLKISGKQLLISTDDGEYPAAGGVPEEGLIWLRDYLLAAVANA